MEHTLKIEQPPDPETGDRRAHVRTPLVKGCKVFHWRSRRYLSARVCDVSRGGALLCVDSPRAVEIDDDLDVLISWDDRALIRSADELSARVVRTRETAAGDRLVAVSFAREAPLAAAA